MQKSARLLILLLGLPLALPAVAAPAAGTSSGHKSSYRWVDENGQVHYGDGVPAAESKQGREVLNNRGTVTKVIPRQLTGAALEAAQAKAKAEKDAEDARQQRIAYDRYLQQSFASVADLQNARDERLTSIDGRMALAQKAIQDNEKTLADLRSRAGDKDPPPALRKQIDNFESSLIDSLKAVAKLKEERTSTETRYTADIERFKQLRAGSVHPGD